MASKKIKYSDDETDKLTKGYNGKSGSDFQLR